MAIGGGGAGSRARRVGAAAFLLAAVTAFHLATIRGGQGWDDDFAQYVLHARNLAEGRPYSDTGYLYNPHYPWLGPQSYPPGFPAILAPVHRTFGAALRPMQVLVVLFLGATLCAVLVYLTGELPFAWALAATACVGLNPFLWEFKDAILSEIPFTFFVWTGLILVRRATLRGEGEARAPLAPWLLVGLLFYLATAIRSVGVVLLPGLVLYHLLCCRRVTRTSVVALAVAIGLSGLQVLLLGPSLSYGDQLRGPGPWLLGNVVYYVRSLTEFWASGSWALLHRGLTVALLVLAGLGFLRRWRRPSPLEVFVPLYIGAILLWPGRGGARYLLPVLPAWVLYAATGVQRLRDWKPWIARAVAAGLAVAIASTYAVRYGRADFGPLREGVETPGAVELFGFIRRETPPDAVLIVRRPRALALYTERRASVYHSADDPALLAYFRQVRATHVVVGPFDATPLLTDLVRRHPEEFEPVYEGVEYRVFRCASLLRGSSDEP